MAADSCPGSFRKLSNVKSMSDVQHNKQREEWHRLKEKNPRLAATIEAKAAGGVVESGTDKSEDSSDDEDEDEDEVRLPSYRSRLVHLLYPLNWLPFL